MRSCTAVATLLTFCPPGPEAARNFSSTIASSGSSATAEADIVEAQRQRRLGMHVGLAFARDGELGGVEHHCGAAFAVDRVADDRQAEALGGMDANLVGAAGLGEESE